MSRVLIALCLAGLGLLGCTPKYDWRVIQSEEYRWSATFPAKPVEVSRTVSMSGVDQPVKLTLRSAKVGEVMFAVGWVVGEAHAEKIRAALEAAMLKNINHDPASLKVKTVSAVSTGGQTARQVFAAGKMQLDNSPAPTDARLWMRSMASPNPTVAAIEIIAVGPAGELTEEIALQFIESLKIR